MSRAFRTIWEKYSIRLIFTTLIFTTELLSGFRAKIEIERFPFVRALGRSRCS